MNKITSIPLLINMFVFSVSIFVAAQPQKMNRANYYEGQEEAATPLANPLPGKGSNSVEGNVRIIKDVFKVNSLDGPGGAYQSPVSTAHDSIGNFAAVWLDYRNGDRDLYVQFYDSNGELKGVNQKVNAVPASGITSPSISSNKKGDYVICWIQDYYIIMAQRFTPDGNKAGSNFRVNETTNEPLAFPVAAINDDGSFLVVWVRNVYGNYECFSRLYYSDGNPQVMELTIFDGTLNAAASFGPEHYTATDGKGNYVLVWNENTTSGSGVYLQKLNSLSHKVGTPVLVSTYKTQEDKYSPQIAAAGGGNFFITWEVGSTGAPLYVERSRIFNYHSGFVTEPLRIPGANSGWDPGSVISDYDSLFLAAFFNGMYAVINTSGEIIDTAKFKVNGREPLTFVYTAPAAINEQGYYITFVTNKIDDSDIFMQKYNSDSSPEGELRKVNDDIFSSWQILPQTYSNQQGSSIVLWDDLRNGKRDLYAQVYDSLFNPVGENIKINDSSEFYQEQMIKTAGYFKDGSFLVFFEGRQDAYDRRVLYTQKISTSGNKEGLNRQFSEPYYEYINDISANINDNGEILLCRCSPYSVSMYNSENLVNGLHREKNILKAKNNNFSPLSIAVNKNLDVLAAWAHNYYSDVADRNFYALLFDKTGKMISDTLRISENESIYYLNSALDGNNFALTWQSNYGSNAAEGYYYNGKYEIEKVNMNTAFVSVAPEIAQFTNSKLLVTYLNWQQEQPGIAGHFVDFVREKGEAYPIQYLNSTKFINQNVQHSACFSNNKLFVTWAEGDAGTGYDIFGKVVEPEGVTFNYEFNYPKAYDDVLYGNYPNPFNASTRIAYEILSYHRVKLAIYDILGSEVKVLVDKDQEKGLYEVQFNAGELTSGVYFIRLQSFRTSVKKMIIMR